MARRRKTDTFFGLIVLAAVVIGILSWLKENVVNKADPSVWGILIIVVTSSISWRLRSGIRQRQRAKMEAMAREQEAKEKHAVYLAWGVEKAVSIATHQKWVSPHRLKTQIHITDKQAAEFLLWGETAGLLRQDVNGRYYTTKFAIQAQAKGIEGPSPS